MKTSAADIVKTYLEKYIAINQLKTQQRRYHDQALARQTLAVAYDIVHEMEHLIRSNNANDFSSIKQCLRQQVGIMRRELRKKQSMLELLFAKTVLPPDFSRCLQEAWSELRAFEKAYDPDDAYRRIHEMSARRLENSVKLKHH